MKEEKKNLVIFEEDKLLISVWRDYFSESYNLNFLDFNSKLENIKKYINKKTIFICNNAQIKHLGAKSSNIGAEYDKVRNWHWIWSKFYFNKKHHGYLIAIISGLPTFFSALAKFSIYFFINKKKRDTYFYRMFGFISALIGRDSFLRPNLDD